jgi:TRAP-type uncharacterized transport system fused permease subunit
VVVLGVMFAGYTPELAAFWGCMSTLVLSWRHRKTAMGPRSIFQALAAGGKNNTSAGCSIGALGIIIGGIVLSGLGLKFSAILIDFAHGSLFFTIILVTIISIVIGMGSSTTGSYIILSVVAAPALIQLGVPEIAAHLVVFYAACLSNITPPVCVSAYAGAAIANADPMRTGLAALKFGATLIIIPFSFVYAPGLLLYGDVLTIVSTVVRYLFGYLALAMAIQGTEFLLGRITPWQRLVCLGATICLLIPSEPWIDGLGVVLLVAGWTPVALRHRAARG